MESFKCEILPILVDIFCDTLLILLMGLRGIAFLCLRRGTLKSEMCLIPRNEIKTDWLAIGRAESTRNTLTRIAPRNVFLFMRCG